MKNITAKKLILDILMANQGQVISAKQAIAACEIFNISVNNTRVTLVRLSAEGLIESPGRAMYQLTDDAHTLADDVATWRTRSTRTRVWDGSFIMIKVNKTPKRTDKQIKNRNRALLMLGFQALEKQLYIRPNNIEDSLDTVRHRLHKLGLEKEAPIFCANQFDPPTLHRIQTLWEPQTLEHTYEHLEQRINHWLQRHERLETDVAARESFLLGSRAIKHIAFDPFLPKEWINIQTRERFLQATEQLDRVGRQIWHRLWQEKDAF